jgi:hypothetical protein
MYISYMLCITDIRITGGLEGTSHKLLIITSSYIVHCRLFLSSYILYELLDPLQ